MSERTSLSQPLARRFSACTSIFCLVLSACSSDGGDNPGFSGMGANSGLATGGDGSLPASGGNSNFSTGGASVDGTGGAASGGDASTASGGSSTSTGGGAAAGALVLEEEQAGHCSVNGIVESTHAGFSGAGYLNADNNASAGITWSLAIGQAGTYSVSFVYANGGADRPAEVLVGDVVQSANTSFPATTDWTSWSKVTVELALDAGTHTIRLDPIAAEGLANIDRIEIEGADATPGVCEVVEEPDGTDPITIWLAGDSTVANGNTPCPAGWGKFFADEFNDKVTVTNWAVGGRSVRTWLYDVTSTMGGDGECIMNTDGSGQRVIQSRWTDMLAQMKEGDYLFIQFGINDGSATCNRHVGGAAFKEEYAMMAKAAVARGVQPVFLTPVSSIRCSGTTAIGSRGFLNETFDVGSAEGVPVIDLHQLSIDLYNQLGFCPVPGGGVSAGTTGPVGDFFCDDHTHFSNSGGARMATVVADALAAAGLDLVAYRNK